MSDKYYALAAPILPGKLEAWKNLVNEIKGPRKKEYQASRKKMGVKHERVFLQHTPQGDWVVVSFEGKDASKVFERFMSSKDPFDQWFGKQVSDIHGFQLSGAPPPPNELYLDIL
ncbi:MAG: DUF6176 family protein [Thaumarchaeota archaeon]|nr:hypothetical protein [Nitrososphaerota archaeon]MCS4540547.1 DUF6176 family protein [Nitrososphaerota archaeon]